MAQPVVLIILVRLGWDDHGAHVLGELGCRGYACIHDRHRFLRPRHRISQISKRAVIQRVLAVHEPLQGDCMAQARLRYPAIGGLLALRCRCRVARSHNPQLFAKRSLIQICVKLTVRAIRGSVHEILRLFSSVRDRPLLRILDDLFQVGVLCIAHAFEVSYI